MILKHLLENPRAGMPILYKLAFPHSEYPVSYLIPIMMRLAFHSLVVLNADKTYSVKDSARSVVKKQVGGGAR